MIPSLNVSLLTKLCELSIISERILCELYSESRNMSQSQSQKISAGISSDLSKWRSSLPPQLDYISYPRESVLLPQAFCLLYVLHSSRMSLVRTKPVSGLFQTFSSSSLNDLYSRVAIGVPLGTQRRHTKLLTCALRPQTK